MRVGTLAALPSHLFMAAFVAIFFGYVDLYLFYSGAISVPALYMFLALLAGFAVILLMHAAVSARLKGEIVALYAAHAWVLASLGAITFFTFVFAFLPGAYWGDGLRYVLYPISDSLVIALSMLLPVPHHHRQHFRHYVLCAFVVLLASVFWDAYYPGTFTFVPDRAAGFAQNPNTGAFVLVLLCCCLVDFERQRLGNFVLIALASLGVLATMSRGGGILLALLFAFYTYRIVKLNRHQLGRLLRYAAALVVAVAIIFAAGVYFVRAAGMFALAFQPRLGMFSGEAEVVAEDDDRLLLAMEYLDAVVDSPLVGYGTAYTYSQPFGPHNMYLQQWVNNGLPGLVAYLMLLGTCALVFLKRRYPAGLLFVCLVAVNGFFSHNILEERAFLAPLGVLLTLSFYAGNAVAVSGERSPRAPARYRYRGQVRVQPRYVARQPRTT